MENNFSGFQPLKYCATHCRGQCCKHMACHYSPTDFEEISFEALKAEIERGFISIDWWENDEPEYYLRVRHVNAPVVDPSWGGRCILLTSKGCPLPFEKRPLGARALKPSSTGRCEQHYPKEQCKNDWLVYDDILRRLVEYFTQK